MRNISESLNASLAKKHTGHAYMYPEYPHKTYWKRGYDKDEYQDALGQLMSYTQDTQLYVHLPFCRELCWFCSCYKVISRDYDRVKNNLDLILKEFDLLRSFLEENSITISFKKIHLGGGSPSYLNAKDFDRLVDAIETLLEIKKLDEFAIEIDPRNLSSDEDLLHYHERGINRLSFGVQDFDLNIQKAVNRIQPAEMLWKLLTPRARKCFDSVSFDILHGLPRQTPETFRETIATVLKFSPDRVSLLCYEHRPDLDAHQKLLKESEFPSPEQRSVMFLEAVETLTSNGYIRVGLEHLAKPTDSLAKAWQERNVDWNMAGYTPGRGNKILGVGPSAESRITDSYYFENISRLPDYEAAVKRGEFPIHRSYKLNDDDMVRREVIISLRNNFSVVFHEIEEKYNMKFREYFRDELSRLDEFIADGMMELSDNRIDVREEGKQFVSFACRVFDIYHQRAFSGARIAHTS